MKKQYSRAFHRLALSRRKELDGTQSSILLVSFEPMI
jgi:hypothetical protein